MVFLKERKPKSTNQPTNQKKPLKKPQGEEMSKLPVL